MKKIILIIPYFGRFPDYFPLFLKSCKNNPTIDWLIFTDTKEVMEYPSNIHVITMSFYQFCSQIQSKFEFDITLNTPYKLCDYKPAYGYIFQEYLEKYDFWGYCDLDLLFGNLRDFFTEDKLNYYDKIGHLGHLTLYRNTTDINTLFTRGINGRIRYQEVFTTNRICVFDEWDDMSINHLFLYNGKRVWFWNEFFDVYPYSDNLTRVVRIVNTEKKWLWREKHLKAPVWILWENGRIFAQQYWGGRKKRVEYAYVHFQKRNMEVQCNFDEPNILCLNNRFEGYTGKIPLKNRIQSLAHWFIDRTLMKHKYLNLRYKIAVMTSPFRQCFRK